jgi:putative flippase GtrA
LAQLCIPGTEMSAIAQIKKTILEYNNSFVMFLMVGCLTAGTYLSLFIVLSKAFHGNYQIAVSISYIVSVILHFSANRKFTFKKQTNLLSHQLPRYLILLVVNYLITLVFMHITVEVFFFTPLIGLVLTIGTTCMLSYLISKFWIFQAV